MTQANPRLYTCAAEGCANLFRKLGKARCCSPSCSERFKLERNRLYMKARTPAQRRETFDRWYAKNGEAYRERNRDRLRANSRRHYHAHPDHNHAWLEANRERVVAMQKKSHWKRRYNLTAEQVAELLVSQDFVCANRACGAPLIGDDARRLHIDHDHACCPGSKSCGLCIRGLLCHNCNIAAGLLGEDPEIVLGLVHYLRESMF